jgi:hypothetical protein
MKGCASGSREGVGDLVGAQLGELGFRVIDHHGELRLRGLDVVGGQARHADPDAGVHQVGSSASAARNSFSAAPGRRCSNRPQALARIFLGPAPRGVMVAASSPPDGTSCTSCPSRRDTASLRPVAGQARPSGHHGCLRSRLGRRLLSLETGLVAALGAGPWSSRSPPGVAKARTLLQRGRKRSGEPSGALAWLRPRRPTLSHP